MSIEFSDLIKDLTPLLDEVNDSIGHRNLATILENMNVSLRYMDTKMGKQLLVQDLCQLLPHCSTLLKIIQNLIVGHYDISK